MELDITKDTPYIEVLSLKVSYFITIKKVKTRECDIMALNALICEKNN